MPPPSRYETTKLSIVRRPDGHAGCSWWHQKQHITTNHLLHHCAALYSLICADLRLRNHFLSRYQYTNWRQVPDHIRLCLSIPGLYLSDFYWGGVRVSTGYDWPSNYSGHGGCQIGKRHIVVHKYTGLARKWNQRVVRGVRVDPQKSSAEFSGGQLPLAGVKPPWTPRQIQPWTILVHQCHSDTARAYVNRDLQWAADSSTQRRLRSSPSNKLLVPRTRLKMVGDCAFCAVTAHIWNDLPPSVTSASSISVFKCLKLTCLINRLIVALCTMSLQPRLRYVKSVVYIIVRDTWGPFWWRGQLFCSRLSWCRCLACPSDPRDFLATLAATSIFLWYTNRLHYRHFVASVHFMVKEQSASNWLDCTLTIGVARILSGGVHFFLPKKLMTIFLVVTLKDRLNIPPNLTRPAKNVLKIDSCSGRGVHFVSWGVHLHIFTVNYAWKIFFSPPWGVQVHPLHPLATPMTLTTLSQQLKTF